MKANKKKAPAKTASVEKAGMARPVGQFTIEMQKPSASVHEWKSILETHGENLPNDYFKLTPKEKRII